MTNNNNFGSQGFLSLDFFNFKHHGALLISEDGAVHRMKAPKGTLVNSVGAGDSMVAGFLAGYASSHGDVEEALKMGVSAGSASAFHEWLATNEQIQAIYDTL